MEQDRHIVHVVVSTVTAIPGSALCAALSGDFATWYCTVLPRIQVLAILPTELGLILEQEKCVVHVIRPTVTAIPDSALLGLVG